MRNKNEDSWTTRKGRSMRRSAGFVASFPRKLLSLSRLQKAIAAVFFSGLLPSLALAGPSDQDDLTQLPFEQLLNTNIVTATKLTNQVSQASSAVSIVTAEDIRAYGYRSLDDILAGMRGLYMTHTFQYGSLGGRGFGAPDDYVGRINILIDGLSANENFSGSSFFGADGALDVDLIDRVEYIPGPGSIGYGNGAFLGVVNIITKKGADLDGAQLAQEFGSHGWNKSRFTYGRQLDNGLDFLLSASSYSNDGRVFSTSLETDEQGKAKDESNKRLFFKAAYQGWSLESAWVRRPVYQPVDHYPLTDEMSLFNLKYDGNLATGLKFSAGTSWGEYRQDITIPEVDDGSGNLDTLLGATHGQWWTVNTKFVGTWFDDHTLVFGAEYRNDYQQDYHDYIFQTSGIPYDSTSTRNNVQLSHSTSSFYLYDDYDFRSDIQLNYGLRYDHRNDGRSSVSPRAAIIWKPVPGSVLKLSSGVANRESSAFIESGNPLPRTERALTQELVWEQKLTPRTQLISSLYRYRIDGQTVWDTNGVDIEQKIYATGAEIELDHNWNGGSRLKVSYAWQDAHNELDHWLFNSPHHNLKLNFTTPLMGEKLRVGVEARFLSERRQYDDQLAPGYGVADLTLTSSEALPGWHASLSVRNIFNRSYGDVRGMWDSQDPAELRLFPMDGRNFWLQLRRDFK